MLSIILEQTKTGRNDCASMEEIVLCLVGICSI